MDLTESIAPRSDQANAEDFLSGPRTFTISEVRPGASPEQPVDIYLAEFDPHRPFKPSKTVRRILVTAWGKEAEAYVGRRLTLFNDPSVKFGGQSVGGIRVSHLSHIEKPLTVALTVTRGKKAPVTVQPLKEAPPQPARDFLAEAKLAAGDVESLKALWSAAGQAGAPQEVLDQIRAQAAPVENSAV
jgi:hypothetical protein